MRRKAAGWAHLRGADCGPLRGGVVQAVALLLILGLGSVGGAPGPAQALAAGPVEARAPAAPSVQLSVEEAVLLVKAFQSLPREVDRTAFDVGARAATFKTVEAAFAFVRDEIANEVYPGALRGAAGTLSAKAGNAADKTLLLGALLVSQKRQVRFARCELDDERAEVRVRSVFEARKSPPRADYREALVGTLVRLGMSRPRSIQLADAQAARDREQDRLVVATAESDLALAREALKRANLEPTPASNAADFLEEARAHHWLQVKEGARWQDLDPAFRTAAAGRSFCEATETSPQFPEDAYQTITVRVRNEFLAGGELHDVTDELQAFRAPDLHGQALVFFNLTQLEGPEGRASPSTGFAPVLFAQGRAFLGQVSSLTQEQPEKPAAGKGINLLGGGEGDEGPPQGAQLVAQWLEFEVSAPGRSSTEARAVVDAVAPAERARGSVTTRPDPDRLVAALGKPLAVAISTGRLDPVACLEATQPYLDPEALRRIWSSPPSKETSREEANLYFGALQGLLATRALAMVREVDRALSGPWAGGYRHATAYRDQPLIVIADFGTDAGKAGSLSLDLRSDRARVVASGEEHAGEAFWLNAHRGMIDGALERHDLPFARIQLPANASGGVHNAISTSAVLDLARAANIGWQAASGEDAVRLLQNQGDAGGYRLARELDERTAAVMPGKPVRVDGRDRLAMWTIDLVSGQVIPLLDDGLRGDTAEYGFQQTEIRTYESVRLRGLSKLLRKCIEKHSWALVNKGACDGLISALDKLNREVMAQIADTVITAL